MRSAKPPTAPGVRDDRRYGRVHRATVRPHQQQRLYQVLVQRNSGSGNGGSDTILEEPPPMSVEADPDTLALRDGKGDSKFRRVTVSQLIWKAGRVHADDDRSWRNST